MERAREDGSRTARRSGAEVGRPVPRTGGDAAARGVGATTEPEQPEADHGRLPLSRYRASRHEGLDASESGPPGGPRPFGVPRAPEEARHLPRDLPELYQQGDRSHSRQLPPMPRSYGSTRLH